MTNNDSLVGESSATLANTELVPEEITTRERGERFWVQWPAIDDYATSELIAIMDWVESDGLLRISEELAREVTNLLGFARRGRRINQALQKAMNLRRPQ